MPASAQRSGLNPLQLALIRATIEHLAPGPFVRITTNNDDDGAGLAVIKMDVVAETGREDLSVERAMPVDAKDWNNVLFRCEQGAGPCELRSRWPLLTCRRTPFFRHIRRVGPILSRQDFEPDSPSHRLGLGT